MKRLLLPGVVACALIGCTPEPYPERAAFVASLFTGAEQYENFGRLDEVFPVAVVKSPSRSFVFERGDQMTLPAIYTFRGESRDNQWWIMEGDEGEYSAIDVYNQLIYVNPTRNLVITKLSANSNYATSLDESAYRELETIDFFRAIGRSLETP